MSQVRIYIVRHGETRENKQKIIQGQLDTVLNFEGERQADLVAGALNDVPFDVCYSSDLQRAMATAKRILVHHSGVELQTQIAVRERYMGDFQGRVWGKFKGLVPENGERAEVREPESAQSVKERAVAWWNETIVGTAASHVLIVSHGAWIRLLVQRLLEDEAVRAAHGVTVGRCLNTGVTIIEIPRERGRGQVLQYGNVAHLREAGADAVEGNADEGGIKDKPRD
ncbi:histidine phosphatase superfamily [Russula brevipes]|nr:histidine phosphatase superfamily [Russula brevipes]